MSSSVLNPGNHITSPEQQQQQPSAIIGFWSAVAFVSTKGCESVHVQTMLALQPHETTKSWAGRGPLDPTGPAAPKSQEVDLSKSVQACSDALDFHLHTSILACKHMQTILMRHCHSLFPSLSCCNAMQPPWNWPLERKQWWSFIPPQFLGHATQMGIKLGRQGSSIWPWSSCTATCTWLLYLSKKFQKKWSKHSKGLASYWASQHVFIYGL